MARRLCVTCVVFLAITCVAVAEPPAIALAIVHDTSGSMREKVRDTGGNRSPKYEIANRALASVVARLEQFQQTSGAGRELAAGLFVFKGENAREAVPFGRFDAAALRAWTKSFLAPDGPTPLGYAVQAAGNALRKSGAAARHVLVITDGENTAGPEPAAVMAAFKSDKESADGAILFHFIAFDVQTNAFRKVKEQGATVVAAADEKELNEQLEFILEEKILLEK